MKLALKAKQSPDGILARLGNNLADLIFAAELLRPGTPQRQAVELKIQQVEKQLKEAVASQH